MALFQRETQEKIGICKWILRFFPSNPQGIFSLPPLGAEFFLWKKEKRGGKSKEKREKSFFFLRMFRVWRFGIFTSFAALWRCGKAPGRGSRKTGQDLLLSSPKVYFYFLVLFFLFNFSIFSIFPLILIFPFIFLFNFFFIFLFFVFPIFFWFFLF